MPLIFTTPALYSLFSNVDRAELFRKTIKQTANTLSAMQGRKNEIGRRMISLGMWQLNDEKVLEFHRVDSHGKFFYV
jgi:hypothetical protein